MPGRPVSAAVAAGLGAIARGVLGSRRLAGAVLVLVVATLIARGPAGASPGISAAAALFDDDNGIAIFDGRVPLLPGETRSGCIALGTDGVSLGQQVTLTATNVTGPLAAQLAMVVEAGTGGRAGDCSGFSGTAVWSGTLADLAATADAGGVPTGWQPAEVPSRSFRITTSLVDDPTAAGRSATADLVWQTTLLADTPIASIGASGQAIPAEVVIDHRQAAVPPDVLLRNELGPDAPVSKRVEVLVKATAHSAPVPLGGFAVGAAFVALQNALDRRDPKLARAPRSHRDTQRLIPDLFPPSPDGRP